MLSLWAVKHVSKIRYRPMLVTSCPAGQRCRPRQSPPFCKPRRPDWQPRVGRRRRKPPPHSQGGQRRLPGGHLLAPGEQFVLLYVDFVQLPSCFCQIPICPGRIGQTVEHSNFKSTQPIPRSDGTPCRFHNLPRFADELRSQEIL